MTKAQAVPVVHIDDDRFKVTEWQFAPGAETGWYVHGHDYVIVPLTDGAWIAPDDAYAGQMAERDRLILAAPDAVHALLPEGEAAVAIAERPAQHVRHQAGAPHRGISARVAAGNI